MSQPRAVAEAIERQAALPGGDAERFSGYAVMALPFGSGHVLALRRWAATSLGRAYSSVWHRTPDGRWTFYSSEAPAASCPRYFSSVLADAIETPIDIVWTGDRTLCVRISTPVALDWELTLTPTVVTGTMNGMASLVPGRLWRQGWFLAMMGRMASLALSAGRVRMWGHVPNGQWFMVNPRRIWMVADSRARLEGEDLGPIGPLSEQARLADVWIPQRGIFAVGQTFMEPYDARRHTTPQRKVTNDGVQQHAPLKVAARSASR
jgi:hypothetical protein